MSPEVDAPPAFLSGETFVEEDHAPPDFRVAAANAVAHICLTTTSGHILVYAPGSGEIATIKTMIQKTCSKLHVSVLFSAMSLESQKEALCSTSAEKGKRRCLIATDIAIRSPADYAIQFVVDTGLRKLSIYNPRLNMHMLETRPITRETAAQRLCKTPSAGYVCVRLYSESSYDDMSYDDDSDFLNGPAHREALRLLARDTTNLAYHAWDETPHPDTLARAVQDLVAMDLVDGDGKVTETGKSVNAIIADLEWLEPAWGLAIHEAARLGCLQEVIAIAAICNAKSDIFQDHSGMEKIAGIVQAKFASGPSDHLALLNAFAHYKRLILQTEEQQVKQVWCKLHTLNLNALEAVDELVKLLSTRTASLKLSTHERLNETVRPPPGLAGRDINVLQAITRGFCTQIAFHEGPGDKYRTFETDVNALLHAKSALVGVRPRWVVYTKLSRRSRRQYLDIVSAVDVNWIMNLKNFQPSALALGRENEIRQPTVNRALDAARAAAATIPTQEDDSAAK
ncbi:hypothetical protein NLG97_g7357 [Lecanicillium saksenae]|uniref:Uncharacterized protein n=1 Tax=Lecanicillium saksenae TaxID=468837 RepID=A0ACC1QNP9_9HYPO|nr:hypothetical protein NLG97_g7357 [Lecanicillium saksenae]